RQAQPDVKSMPLQSLTQTNKREVESYNCSFELLNLRWTILFLLVNKQNFQVATAEILKNTVFPFGPGFPLYLLTRSFDTLSLVLKGCRCNA
ncbi:hypothetical protein, partial [uncultured Christiangramia sp.]|uniref:hypothetical protein n=1 Tax=uncultured Christiangramia sp. TaxID=503836 RepID=UPI0025ED846F